MEDGDLISYSIENRTLDVTGIQGIPCSKEEAAKVLEERAEKGIVPRPVRKGFFRMYTENARSAMEGGGLE